LSVVDVPYRVHLCLQFFPTRRSSDLGAVRLRVANELKPLETQTSALVKSIDQEVSEELARAVSNMRDVQRRIVLVVHLSCSRRLHRKSTPLNSSHGSSSYAVSCLKKN